MGLSAEQIRESMDALAAASPDIAAALGRIGYPEPRIRERGYATLVRTILGQQVSVASANAHWRRLNELLGDATDPTRMHGVTDEELRDHRLCKSYSWDVEQVLRIFVRLNTRGNTLKVIRVIGNEFSYFNTM